MKILARLCISHREVDAALMARLRSEVPEQDALRGFSLFAPLDSEAMRTALDLLDVAGLKPWDFRQGRTLEAGSEYFLSYERVYDAADLQSCEYLEIAPPAKGIHLEAHERTEAGQIILPKYKMPRGFDIMITHLHAAYFVTDRARGVLEAADLSRLSFPPACYGPGRLRDGETEESVAAQFGRPYWEIDSDFTLPPLSPTMSLKTSRGGPWHRGNYSDGLQACEGLFQRPELHYRRSDLDRLEPFDLARTQEQFGNYKSYDRLKCPLVASRRFYETCAAGKVKTGWVPVRVDPE